MAAEPYNMELHPSVCISKSYCPRNMVQAGTLHILCFPVRDVRRLTQRTSRTRTHSLPTAARTNPEEAEQQICSTSTAESLPPALSHSFCKSFCNLAGGRTCSWMHIIVSALYQQKKNHTVRRGAVKVSTNAVNWRIFVMKQAAPKTPSDLDFLSQRTAAVCLLLHYHIFQAPPCRGLSPLLCAPWAPVCPVLIPGMMLSATLWCQRWQQRGQGAKLPLS